MTTPTPRRLIVNADDFGLSPCVNSGIALACRQGVLTSATIMANAPFFHEAVTVAAANPDLGVGLHLNLVRGTPLSPATDIPLLLDAAGHRSPFRLRRLSRPFLEQAETEYRKQLEAVLDNGITPTHIDFEKHHAWQAPLYNLACRLAAGYGIRAVRNLREPVIWSLRHLGWPGWKRVGMAVALRCGIEMQGTKQCPLARPDRLLGQTHIGLMDNAAWLRLIPHLPAGISEVMTHPGKDSLKHADTELKMGESWLTDAREKELNALISEEVREALDKEGIRLVNFRELNCRTKTANK